MEKEFNLNEKAKEIARHYEKMTDMDTGVQLGISLIMQLNKEFIEKLKKEFESIDEYYKVDVMTFKDWASEKIDKLAGPKWIEID